MAALRLAALLFLLGLTASRVGLLLHELAGHGGAAAVAGCQLTELRLFLFGGGYVGYACPPLAPGRASSIDLGGIAVELAVGVGAIALARRRAGTLALFATVAGWLFVLHALFYLATGMHYGAGDGRLLHARLGSARGGLVAVVSVALVGGSGVAAIRIARRVVPWLAAPGPGSRATTLALAALAAAAGHGALLRAEQTWIHDPVYAATFEPEHERQAAVELRRFEEERPRTPAELERERRVLVARAAPFPLTPVLGAAMAAAALLGIASAAGAAPPRGPAPTPPLARLALACAGSLALVAAVDRLL